MLRSFSMLHLLLLATVAVASMLGDAPAGTQATVTFTLDFPNSQPEHYAIRVQTDGAGRYESTGSLGADPEQGDNSDLGFTLTAPTEQKIFKLAARAGYFQQDVDSHKKLAFTGKKTLGYKDAQRTGESTYNYSLNGAVQELTALMQGLASTLEVGRRLDFDRRYQKLALDEELKRMEEMARSHDLVEVTVIQPILEQIGADPSIINVTRARAQRLLQGAGVR